jgi:molybdate transport system substrate-binding protein
MPSPFLPRKRQGERPIGKRGEVKGRSGHRPPGDIRTSLVEIGTQGAHVTETGGTPVVEVLSTLALRGVLVEIAEDFRASTSLRIAATYRSTNAALDLIAQCTSADLTILTREAMARLERDGVVRAGSTVDLAQSGVGIAVRAGLANADISTVAACKRALLEAKSIAFSRQGASGIHFAEVIERLGIAAEIRRKATITDSYAGEAAARGEVDMAVQQLSELVPIKGIDIVGPLPAELQKISVFAGGIFHAAKNADGAGKLLAVLAAPTLVDVLIRSGLEPVSP